MNQVGWRTQFKYRFRGSIAFRSSAGVTTLFLATSEFSTIDLVRNPNGDLSTVSTGIRGDLDSPNKRTQNYRILVTFQIWKGRVPVPSSLSITYLSPATGHIPSPSIQNADLTNLLINYILDINCYTNCVSGGSLAMGGNFENLLGIDYNAQTISSLVPSGATQILTVNGISTTDMVDSSVRVYILIQPDYSIRGYAITTPYSNCSYTGPNFFIVHRD